MIQRVWEAASRSKRLTELIVATDSREVADVVESFGGKAVLTGAFESGTDRVAHVAQLPGRNEQIVVNLQGDEPLLAPESIDKLVDALERSPDCGMATLAVKK